MQRDIRSRLSIHALILTLGVGLCTFSFLLWWQNNNAGDLFALTTVTLDNGDTTVPSYDDITSQADLGSDTGVYQWTVDGEDLMPLNIAFNTGSQVDFSSAEHTITLQNGAVVQTNDCRVGTCVFLDGVDDHVEVAHSAQLDFANADSFSVGLWINTTDAKASIRAAGKQNIAGQNGIYAIIINSGLPTAFIRDTNGVTTSIASSVSVNDGDWHHLALVRDTLADTLKIYVDGGKAGSVTDASTGSFVSAIPFLIGAHNPPGSTDNFNGLIDDVQVVNRALTGAQINHLYNDGTAGVGGPRTVSSLETQSPETWGLDVTAISPLGAVTGTVSANSVTITGINPINLCTTGGQAADAVLAASELNYENLDVIVSDCTFAIDGAHTFNSLRVLYGGIVTHTSNAPDLMTLTVINDVIIDQTSSINLNTKGYRGGFRDGQTVNGEGPGGGIGFHHLSNSFTASGGGAAYGGAGANPSGANGNGSGAYGYGDINDITDKGSGGGAGRSGGATSMGGNGGGFISISAGGTVTIDGTLAANGQNGQVNCCNRTSSGGGSGGGIVITASSVLGSGTISANGGTSTDNSGVKGGGGSGGRIHIVATSTTVSGNLLLEAHGGAGTSGNVGGPGTIFFKDAAQAHGNLLVENNGNTPQSARFEDSTPINSGDFDTVTVRDAGVLTVTALADITTLSLDGGTLLSHTIGVHQIDTITVINGGNLRIHTADTADPYTLEVNALSVNVDEMSTITGDGYGHRGGFRNGNTVNGEGSGGGVGFHHTSSSLSASGGGGAHGGAGADPSGASTNGSGGVAYGALTTLGVSGSGGGAGRSGSATSFGGNGGGLVAFTVSGTFTNNGIVSSNGQNGQTNCCSNTASGGGSGGIVSVIAASIEGAGVFRANGGQAFLNGAVFGGSGGGGRINLETTVGALSSSLSLEAHAGGGTGHIGGPGTILTKSISQTNPDLLIENGSLMIQSTKLEDSTPVAGGIFDSVTVLAGGVINFTDAVTSLTLLIDSATVVSQTENPHTFSNVSIQNTGILRNRRANSSTPYPLIINADVLSVDSTSSIFLDSQGYRGGISSGNLLYNGEGSGGGTGFNQLNSGQSAAGGGGAYAGNAPAGSGSSGNGAGGTAYGLLASPDDFGSGGGAAKSGAPVNAGGNGGGLLVLNLSSNLTNEGSITANGGNGAGSGNRSSGGGGGGGIYVTAASILGSGTFTANGGDAFISGAIRGGAGGGGRIALVTTSGAIDSTLTHEAYGGAGSANLAAAGTIYLKPFSQTNPDLVVDNNSTGATVNTPLFISSPPVSPTSYTFRNFSVVNLAHLAIGIPCSGTALSVTGVTDLSGGGQISNSQPGFCLTTYTTPVISTAALPASILGQSYSETMAVDGGVFPFTFTIIAGSLEPNLTIEPVTGEISGTPLVGGTYNFTVEVTDSNPEGGQTDTQAYSLSVGTPPNTPGFVSPADATVFSEKTIVLKAQYSDADTDDTGTTQYRVSSGSAANCINNVNIVASGSSVVTATNNEITQFTTPSLSDKATYSWCARNNDGNFTSNSGAYSSMGTFTVDTSTGGGNPAVQQQQQPQQQTTDPQTGEIVKQEPLDPNLSVPQIGTATVVSDTEVTYTWTYNGANQLGFRIIDNIGKQKAQFAEPSARSGVERNLPNNSIVSDRKVVSYNSNGQSIGSATYSSVITLAPLITPVAAEREGTTLAMSVQEVFHNLATGQSALQFELLIPETGLSAAAVVQSDWTQERTHIFTDIPSDLAVQVRARSRNQSGLMREWSPYVTIEPGEFASSELALTLSLRDELGNTLPSILNPDQAIVATILVQNVGEGKAENIFVDLSLLNLLRYVPSSLFVDGVANTESPDTDAGQVSGGTIASIWEELQPQQTKTIQFSLQFNKAEFKNLNVQTDLIEGLTLLAQASASNAPEIARSSSTLSFDTSKVTFEEPVQELPVEEVPIPEPTLEETNQVEELENEIIEQEVTETGGDNGNAVERPTLTREEQTSTESSSDGQSFTVSVTRETPAQEESAVDELSITGFAQPLPGQIEFTGTASVPGSVVILTFNNSVTIVITSDANGFWQTYVTAEQVGVAPGTRVSVQIQAIAANGDLRSDTVDVGQFTITRAENGDTEMSFESVVSASEVITVAQAVTKQVRRVVEEREEVIQQTLTVTAPVVILSSAPLWGYLPYIPTLLYHFITYLVGLLGRKKKKGERFYGVAYDAITKEPLALAIIRIYNKETNQLMATQVSDKLGRYDFLLQPGAYRLEVKKPQYSFPSQIVSEPVDAEFNHVYQTQQGIIVQEGEITVPDVPLDPENAQGNWQSSNIFKKLWLSLQKAGHFLAVPLLFVGALASVVVVATVPENPVNWLLAVVYVFLFFMQLKLRQKTEKSWGTVYDVATNAPIPLVGLQLVDPTYGKVVATRLSDYQGRFRFAPEPGKYVLKAEKEGFTQTDIVEGRKDRSPLNEQITVQRQGESMNGDVPLRQI